MLLTLSKPHVVAGKKLENRISKEYFTFFGIADLDEYCNNCGIFTLTGNSKRVMEKVFEPSKNKQNYLVLNTDNNKTLPSLMKHKYNFYEPVIIKVWVPDEEILKSALVSISSTLYLRQVEFHEKNFKNNNILNYFNNWAYEYNNSFDIEKEKRNKLEEDLTEYESTLDLIDGSRYYNLI